MEENQKGTDKGGAGGDGTRGAGGNGSDRAKHFESTEKRPHILQSEFAKSDLNEWLKRLVETKRAVKYLEQEQVRTTLRHVDSEWKKVHEALSQRQRDLKDLQNSVKACWETYQDCLKLESEGKYLE